MKIFLKQFHRDKWTLDSIKKRSSIKQKGHNCLCPLKNYIKKPVIFKGFMYRKSCRYSWTHTIAIV